MRAAAFTISLLFVPTEGLALVCRAAPLRIEVEFADTACRIGKDTAIRREVDGTTQCLLSNPQLRIITFHSDGRFTYEDTDNDRIFNGMCTDQ